MYLFQWIQSLNSTKQDKLQCIIELCDFATKLTIKLVFFNEPSIVPEIYSNSYELLISDYIPKSETLYHYTMCNWLVVHLYTGKWETK
ncbi:hypothetical protein GDO81_011793 [Engystomops pustulosus]|uniref:Uncharacterized protein n=1 Tax=Engystomops pustulosus TaxID=76066 RepID=A0AAV7BGU7_ENGPU|nr:hypothetical protein GDO81_011793 [Engystomops pustulosus]